MDDPVRLLLLYFIMPLWFAAGLADYLCHRATGIAQTSGWKESLLHLLMFGEVAILLLMLRYLEELRRGLRQKAIIRRAV
jgi:hypothetical protein